MQKTQQTLNKDLARLGANIPFLVKEFPNTRELWAELAGLIDDIQACASPADGEWVSERIDALLLMNGLSPCVECGNILKGPMAMPAHSGAMGVGVEGSNSFDTGRDPEHLHPLHRQGAEYRHGQADPIRTESLDRGLLCAPLQTTK